MFAGVDVNFRIYAIVFIAVAILLPLHFHKNRRDVYIKVSTLLLANFLAYGLVFLLMRSHLYSVVVLDKIFNVACALIIILIFGFGLKEKKKASDAENSVKLFKVQERDLERIAHYAKHFDAIGINGAWGSGKTFLIKEFMKRNKGEYEFIRIDLLSCNLDELQGLLVDEFERLLLDMGVYSKYSSKLRKMLQKSSVLDKISSVFVDDTATYATALEEFKKELEYVGKTIFVVFEDIDRIYSEDVVKKIFSITEQLICNHVKAIYQYDQANLDTASLNRKFVEKYIPFVVNVTSMEFFDTVRHLHDGLGIDEELISLNVLRDIETMRISAGKDNMPKFDITVRNVKQFLLELQSALKGNAEYQKHKLFVASFFFIKHFYYDAYKKFQVQKSLKDTLTFFHEGKEYTFFELQLRVSVGIPVQGETSVKVKDILTKSENLPSLWTLNFLGYNKTFNEAHGVFDYEKSAVEPIKNVKKKFLDPKKDRLVWNLLCYGTSEFMDYENIIHRMSSEVLSISARQQSEAFERLFDDLADYGDGNEYYGNKTVVMMGGLQFFTEIFRAFHLTDTNKDDWVKLIDFYFRHENISEINLKLVEVLSNCWLGDKDVCFYVVKRFNNLKCVGNMNDTVIYKNFLAFYFRAMGNFCATRGEFLFRYPLIDITIIDKAMGRDRLLSVLQEGLDEIRNLNATGLPAVKEDYKTIAAFIRKNIEIVESDHELHLVKSKSIFDIKSSSSEALNELMTRCYDSEDERNAILNEAYREGKITCSEIDLVQRNTLLSS